MDGVEIRLGGGGGVFVRHFVSFLGRQMDHSNVLQSIISRILSEIKHSKTKKGGNIISQRD